MKRYPGQGVQSDFQYSFLQKTFFRKTCAKGRSFHASPQTLIKKRNDAKGVLKRVIINSSRRYFPRNRSGEIGGVAPHPKPKMIKANSPTQSMYTKGSRLKNPASSAVLSPNFMATQACMYPVP